MSAGPVPILGPFASADIAGLGNAVLRLAWAGQEFARSPEGREAASSGPVDWFLVALAAVAVAAAFVLCARYLVRPGEESEDHIKRRVLREEVERNGAG